MLSIFRTAWVGYLKYVTLCHFSAQNSPMVSCISHDKIQSSPQPVRPSFLCSLIPSSVSLWEHSQSLHLLLQLFRFLTLLRLYQVFSHFRTFLFAIPFAWKILLENCMDWFIISFKSLLKWCSFRGPLWSLHVKGTHLPLLFPTKSDFLSIF